jgi:hypothetical protein
MYLHLNAFLVTQVTVSQHDPRGVKSLPELGHQKKRLQNLELRPCNGFISRPLVSTMIIRTFRKNLWIGLARGQNVRKRLSERKGRKWRRPEWFSDVKYGDFSGQGTC